MCSFARFSGEFLQAEPSVPDPAVLEAATDDPETLPHEGAGSLCFSALGMVQCCKVSPGHRKDKRCEPPVQWSREDGLQLYSMRKPRRKRPQGSRPQRHGVPSRVLGSGWLLSLPILCGFLKPLGRTWQRGCFYPCSGIFHSYGVGLLGLPGRLGDPWAGVTGS